MTIKWVVLTGGPCAGKSAVLTALSEQLTGQVEVATEAASEVIARTGIPSSDWTDARWTLLQTDITRLMAQKEAALEAAAAKSGAAIGILDRAPDDNQAYPMGREVVDEFRRNGYIRLADDYGLVIHLQSLAVNQPDRYEALVRGNPFRYETLPGAQIQDAQTLAAWNHHPNRVVIANRGPIEETIHECVQLVKQLLA